MKFFLCGIFAVVCGSLALRGEPQLANGVAVIVNDSIITYKDVQNLIAKDVEFLERRYPDPRVFEQKLRELEQTRIEDLVEARLILHEFSTAGHQLPESYIETRINQDIRGHGDRLTFTKTLQAQGMTWESYRQKVREGIIIEAMWLRNVSHEILISPHKVELFYVQNQASFKLEDQLKLRMIVLTNRPADTLFSPAKLADEILAKINEGTPFSEMARIYSQGSQSAAGGDWGWVERSVLRQDLAERAFSLKPGQKSVVLAPEGAYIMFVEQSQPAHIKSLSEVRDEIEATLKAQENKRLRKKWIDRLKAKSFVRYF